MQTFQQPLIYRTIRTNLIEAFGGDATAFAVLNQGSYSARTPIPFATPRDCALFSRRRVHCVWY